MKFTVTATFAVMILMGAVGTRGGEISIQYHNVTGPGKQWLIRKWLPLDISNKLVLGVGSRRLPIAIRLPRDVNLATHHGLFTSGGAIRHRHFSVEIFFNSADDSVVRHWVQNLPRDMPLDTRGVSYVILSPKPFNAQLFDAPKQKIWEYEMVLRTSGSQATYHWQGVNNYPKATPIGTDTVNGIDLSRTFIGTDSPVRSQERLVSLRVYF
jgi:hypothetical protein